CRKSGGQCLPLTRRIPAKLRKLRLGKHQVSDQGPAFARRRQAGGGCPCVGEVAAGSGNVEAPKMFVRRRQGPTNALVWRGSPAEAFKDGSDRRVVEQFEALPQVSANCRELSLVRNRERSHQKRGSNRS